MLRLIRFWWYFHRSYQAGSNKGMHNKQRILRFRSASLGARKLNFIVMIKESNNNVSRCKSNCNYLLTLLQCRQVNRTKRKERKSAICASLVPSLQVGISYVASLHVIVLSMVPFSFAFGLPCFLCPLVSIPKVC